MLEKASEFCRTEGAKLKGMSFRGKLEYIWEYYKAPILITAAALLIIWGVADAVWIHPPKKSFVQFAFMEGYQPDEETRRLTEAIALEVMTPEERETLEAVATTFLNNTGDPQMDMANSQKLFAMLAARELDLLVFPLDSLEGMAEQGMIQDLSPFLPEGALEAWRDELVWASFEGERTLCAINAQAVPALKGLFVEGQALCVASSAERLDNIKRVFAFLLD
jgi:hypothetical protein